MAKKLISMRVDGELLEWVDETARAYGFADEYGQGGGKGRSGRTQLVTELLEALRDGRLYVRPLEGVNAFPEEAVAAGESPSFPILICLNPTTAPERED